MLLEPHPPAKGSLHAWGFPRTDRPYHDDTGRGTTPGAGRYRARDRARPAQRIPRVRLTSSSNTTPGAAGGAAHPGAAPESSSVPRRVWIGTGLQALGRVFGSICTLVSLAVLARHLPGEGFGQYTFYLAVFALLDSLTDFGTGQVAIGRTAAHPEAMPAVLAACRRLRLAFATLGLLLVLTTGLAAGEAGLAWILLATLYQHTHALELSATVFKNNLSWAVPVRLRAIASVLRLGIVLAMVAAGVESAAVFLLGTAVGSSVANVLLHRAAHRSVPGIGRGSATPALLGSLLREAWPLGLAALCMQVYFYVDNLFVRAIDGEVAVGRYNGAVRIMSLGIMVAVFAANSGLPWLRRRLESGQVGEAVARLSQPLFALACAGLGLFWPWRAELLRLLLGEGFEVAGPALGWLLFATAAVYLGAPLMTAVVAVGRGRALLLVAGAGLAVNLVGNAWLVPAIGIEGAAAATFATELTVAGGAALVLARAGSSPLRSRPWRWLVGPPLFAASAWLSSLLPLG